MNEIMQTIRDYYAEKKLGDIISVEGLAPSDEAAEALALLPEDMRENKMLLGYPFPPMLEGCTVLVLGARNGRDAFVASKLVGESGKVIAIEGCARGVEKADGIKEEIAQAFGYAKSNVHFVTAGIEDLYAAGIGDDSIDVVIANCAVSHSPFKLEVLSEVYRVLKEGGEFYEFDVFCNRRLDPEQKADPAIAGGLLAETGYDQDFRRTMRKAGWEDFRHMSFHAVEVTDEAAAKAKGEGTTYEGRYVRAVKSQVIEDICEQYGQYATYDGQIPGCPDYFDLDDHHRFFTNEPMSVCSNSCSMVADTRYGAHFKVDGNLRHHYGAFGKCGNVERIVEE